MKTFHISADVHNHLIFINKYDKTKKSKPYKFHELTEKDQEKHKDKIQSMRESEIIEAHDLETARKIFTDYMYSKYDTSDAIVDSPEYVLVRVESIEFLVYCFSS